MRKDFSFPETPARSRSGSRRLNSHQREQLRQFHDALQESGDSMVQPLPRSRSPPTPEFTNPEPYYNQYQTVSEQRGPRSESISPRTALAPFAYPRGAAAGDAVEGLDHLYPDHGKKCKTSKDLGMLT